MYWEAVYRANEAKSGSDKAELRDTAGRNIGKLVAEYCEGETPTKEELEAIGVRDWSSSIYNRM